MDFPDKYTLTPRQSLFLAKKKWDENVYCGMRMENRNVTFPQTKTILDGVNVPNVTLDDIQAILNMRDAWRFMLNTMDAPLTIEYLCSLNGYITRNEQPPIPSLNGAETELSGILSDGSTATEKALNLFTWGARGQLF